jgi:hypothetical protein
MKLDPVAEELDHGRCFPICHPGRLRAWFLKAEDRAVEDRLLEVPTISCDFDDYWTPRLTTHGRALGDVISLSADERAFASSIRATLPIRSDGSIHLTARAWAVQARKKQTAK